MSRHVDGLTAMVMIANAEPTDTVVVQRKLGSRWFSYTYCTSHLEEVAHRQRQRAAKDVKFYPPDLIERMIARDDLQDYFRRDRWRLVSIAATTDHTWHKCPHCRRAAKESR